jgi:hypothetical protein
MTYRFPSLRPNCEAILKAKELWAVNENDFDFENQIKIVYDSELEDRKCLIHSILESKFIAIKVNMIEKREASALEILNLYEHKPDFIRKFLAHLKDYKKINFDLRTNLIELIVVLMSKYLRITDLQLNAIVCIYSFIENENGEKLNPELLEKVVEVTLNAMELYPYNQMLQKSALYILYTKQILENISTERYRCTKLVMDSLVNFKKNDMNLMASIICSTHLMKLSINERSYLGSIDIYIKTLIDVIKSRAHFYSYYYLIGNILSTLVNLLVKSSKNCTIFIDHEGLDVSFTLLKVRRNSN